jgi:hypothetical protein
MLEVQWHGHPKACVPLHSVSCPTTVHRCPRWLRTCAGVRRDLDHLPVDEPHPRPEPVEDEVALGVVHLPRQRHVCHADGGGVHGNVSLAGSLRGGVALRCCRGGVQQWSKATPSACMQVHATHQCAAERTACHVRLMYVCTLPCTLPLSSTLPQHWRRLAVDYCVQAKAAVHGDAAATLAAISY